MLVALMMWTQMASAGSCSLDMASDGGISATMTEVRVGSEWHHVAGLEQRLAFRDELTACGMHDAAAEFSEWRRHRRAVNISAVVGVVFWPAWVVTGLEAILADEARIEMERAVPRRR